MEKTPPLVDQHGDRHFGLWGVLLAESRPSPTNGLQLFLDQVTNCSSTPDATTNTLDGCVRELRQRVPHNLHTHYGLTSNPNSLADFSPCLVVPLFGDVVCIGRLPTSDVVLSGNPCVSGLHCSFAVAVAQPHTHRWSSGHADEVPPNVGGARSDEEVARSVRHEPSTFDGCVPNSAHDEIRNGDGDEHDDDDDDVELRITMCDHSSNGCYVNGKMLGKNHAHNDLRSGDVVELVNAGPRHTTGCNLKFIFLLVEDFIRQAVGSSVAHEGTTPLPTSSITPTTTTTVVEDVNKRRRDLKRQVMLLRAQWEATAQVQRMYGHDVEDFYSLDKSPSGVLGEGAFGSVHRGALNTAHAKASTDALLPLMQHAARVGSMWSEEEEHTCRQAFIDARVNEPPASAVELLAEHASLAKRKTGKPSSSSLRGQQDVEVDAVDASTAFIFAIKMIQRQRVLRDWLLEDADQAEVELKPETKCIPSATREEVRVLKDLIQLETQPPEYANRLERELHDQQREEVLVMLGAESQGSTTQPSQDGRRVALLSQLDACGPGDARLSQREMAQQRELMRQRLLASLHPTLRRAYERELQGQRRQQSELNILRTVSHPHITRLVEVFDHGNTLSLVMEQATGGEAWDLLQPRATRRSAAHPTPTTSSSSSTSVNHQSNMADGHGLSCGGPLPEFLVKIIILQVLEGVRYLHSRGIIHRDLKLENILLQRPCHIQQVCALQLQLLIMRLEAVEKECEGWSTTTNNNSPTLPKEAVGVRSNPLSLIHTIHIQRALWPVVKITDFGLSHVLQTTGQQQQRQRQGATIKGDAGVEDEELHRIYARHEMKTSCGTPVYAAPEVTDLRRRPNRAGYSAAVDLYSVGVMAFALLTGRVPFPVRQHAATNGERARVEVDYTAKVCFDRCRRRRGGAEAATARLTKPPAPSPSPLLPLLGVVAGIHVASTPTSPASDADAHALASPAPTAWTADMKDLAAAVQRAEKNPHMSRFPDTIRLTLRVLKAYARQCVEHQREVDIEHLFWLSMQSHDRGVNTSTADVFPLAPVSPLGQEFILSLLHIDPMKRMNAWDALQHPWLRDAVQSL